MRKIYCLITFTFNLIVLLTPCFENNMLPKSDKIKPKTFLIDIYISHNKQIL